MTKTKIALIAALVTGTAGAALAQDFDPNLANRYPAYAGSPQAVRSAPVGLYQGRNVALPHGGAVVSGQSTFDRASSPNAGGGF